MVSKRKATGVRTKRRADKKVDDSAADLVSLLSGIQMPIILTGPDLRVRHFTPMAERFWNITAADIGRRLTDIEFKIDLPQLPELLQQAIDTNHYAEREVQDHLGRWYSLRIRPYGTHANRGDSAVIALVDIDQLKQDKEKLRLLIELSFEPIIVWDFDKGVVEWNQGCERLYGFTRAEAAGRFIHELLGTEYPLPLEEFKARLLAQGEWKGELCHITKSGREVIVESRQQAALMGGRHIVLEANHDITERRRASEVLREREARAKRTLADQMVAGIAECDASGKFTMVNQRYCDITGRTKAELLEMHISDVTHPEDWPHTAELYRRLFEAGKSFFIEKRYRRKDGSEIWVNAHVSGIRNSRAEIEESVSVVIDVTERKRAEQELAAAKDRLAADLDAMTRLQKIASAFVREGGSTALAEIVDAAIAITRAAKGNIGLFNARSGAFNIVAHRGFDQSHLDFWNTEGDKSLYYTALKRGERVIVEDLTISSLFAGTRELDIMLLAGVRALQATPVLSRFGKLLAVLVTHYARPRRTDERILQPLDVLARQAADVIERAQADADLRSAYEQAEAATRAKDEFLAVVSHELRSPLTSILGYARLLKTEKGNNPKVAHFVDVIERNGKAQLQLIEDLLDTARIIRGKLKLEVKPLDLAGVITAAVDVVRPAAQAKDIRLHSSLDPLAGQITGDPDRLQQVVWNLLSNAIKFTPPGGRVEIALERADPFVQVVIRDTGRGIDPQFLPHVFERFRQSDMSSTRRVGGLGLGLSLVKHLVEMHGGTVDARNMDQGAAFTIRLPLRAVYTPAEPDSPKTLRHKRAKPLNGVLALVVDDEQEVRDLLTLTLKSYGAKVQAVSSGKEALEILSAQKPGEAFDVLISDIGMPDEDGYSLIRKVRALSPDKGGTIPAIAVTAYGSFEHRMRALDAGFQTYAVKPVETDELVADILSVIRGRDAKAG
jgi:PAS domain S-box-containing protein